MTISIGDEAPVFSLPDTDDHEHAFPGDDGLTVVVFTCNHCPYALAWHDRLLAAARDYPDVRFLAINPNDAERYPRDSFEAMKQRVAAEGGWPLPYLRDEAQEAAAAYGARTTPD
ncbi:MAG: redoxin domain-containing protein, partial [Pseudonocardiaceae bacterium]